MMNTCAICYMTPLSLSIAANTRVSNELGAGRPNAAKHASRGAVRLCLIVVSVTTLALLAFRGLWAQLFTTKPEVVNHAVPVLTVAAFYTLADGMAGVIGGCLKGCGRQAVLAPVIVGSYYFIGLP